MTDDLYYRKLESIPTSDLVDMLREKDRRIAEMKEENEELKEQCSILADCNTCHSTCKNENIEMKKQLTKAKEIIGNLLGLLPDEVLYHDFYNRVYVAPAEQFISEVEL